MKHENTDDDDTDRGERDRWDGWLKQDMGRVREGRQKDER